MAAGPGGCLDAEGVADPAGPRSCGRANDPIPSMLPRAHRLRRPHDFRGAVRGGARAGSRTLVVHVVAPGVAEDGTHPGPETTRIGIITSKAVGPAVVRNRVKRRLRHLARARLDLLFPGSLLVVRALPPAASASSRELAADLDAVLARATGVRA